MTTIKETEALTAEEEDAPTVGTLLLRSAPSLRDRAAVQALVDEECILARDNVRTALVVKEGGVMRCSWEGFGSRLYTLGLPDDERAFADFVLSIAGPHQTGMARVTELDERRLLIVLRAMVQPSGCDTIAVGKRI